MMTTESGLRVLNALLRGEIAATETYQQALAKLENSPEAEELKRIHVEHRTAANELRKTIHDCGGKPDQDSGTWGVWAKLVEGTAATLGQTAALKALKEGEEQGIKDYTDASRNHETPADSMGLIRRLIPQTREHIETLDRMMSKA